MGLFVPVDGDPLNVRIENLKLTGRSGAALNHHQQKNNRSGYTGVFQGRKGGFNFHLCIDGLRHWRYGFATARDAATARDELAKTLTPFFRSSVEDHDRISARMFQ